jgi:hypothetical protein
VLVGALAAGPAPAQSLSGSGPSPTSAVLRSLALPGWGQAANGSWIKAVGFFGGYAGFIGWGVSLNQEKQDAVGELNAATDDADRGFWAAEVERLDDASDAKYWLAGAVLLVSMLDAYVDAHLKGLDRRIDAQVELLAPGGEPTLALSVRVPLGGEVGR